MVWGTLRNGRKRIPAIEKLIEISKRLKSIPTIWLFIVVAFQLFTCGGRP
jgi:hypothetical protein